MPLNDENEIDYNMLQYWYEKHGDLSNSMGDKTFKEVFEKEDPVLYRAYKAMLETKEIFETLLSLKH